MKYDYLKKRDRQEWPRSGAQARRAGARISHAVEFSFCTFNLLNILE